MALSHTELRRWYRDYNRRYFDGRLPDDMDVFYAPDDVNHAEATCYRNGERAIQVDTKLAGTAHARIDLLHEMVHHDTEDWTHGKRFQAGKDRLWKAGAFRRIL